MNIWTWMQTIWTSILASAEMVVFTGVYVGTDGSKRDKRYLTGQFIVFGMVKFIINFSYYVKLNSSARTVIMLLGVIFMLLSVMWFRPDHKGVNLLIYFFQVGMYDSILTLLNAVLYKMIAYEYNETPMLMDAVDTWRRMGIETGKETVGLLCVICIVRKLFPYERLCRLAKGLQLFWMAIFTLMYFIIIGFASQADALDLKSQLIAFAGACTMLLIGYYLFTFIYHTHERKLLEEVKLQTEEQQQTYDEAVEDYNKLRDVRHDLYNCVRVMELEKQENSKKEN